MMYDTFHANIEEKSIPDAIRSCADVLCHVHISENDRSTPGRGNIRWAENFDTLKEVVPIWKQENWADGTSEWVHPGIEAGPHPTR